MTPDEGQSLFVDPTEKGRQWALEKRQNNLRYQKTNKHTRKLRLSPSLTQDEGQSVFVEPTEKGRQLALEKRQNNTAKTWTVYSNFHLACEQTQGT